MADYLQFAEQQTLNFFSAVLLLQLQKDKWEKKLQQKIGNSKNIRTSQYLHYYTQKHQNDGAITLYNIENYVTDSVKKEILKNCDTNSVKKINNIHNN